MKIGMILVTYHKDEFNELGVYGVQLAKSVFEYKAETPKTITFEMFESMSRKSCLQYLKTEIGRKKAVLENTVMSMKEKQLAKC